MNGFCFENVKTEKYTKKPTQNMFAPDVNFVLFNREIGVNHRNGYGFRQNISVI